MTLSPKARALSTQGPVTLLAGSPRLGYLVHAFRDQPGARAAMGVGRMTIRARAICRSGAVRHGDLLIQGGPYDPTPVAQALGEAYYACEPCARLVASLVEHGLLAEAAPLSVSPR